jgi:hypothetical protein
MGISMEKSKEQKASEAARTLAKLGASKGGKARAEALTPEERQAIAREAITARWARRKTEQEVELPRATHTGVLKIGDIAVQCAVLEDKRRVLTQRSFSVALGRSKNPHKGQNSISELPPFLALKNLEPFISDELRRSLVPIRFLSVKGGVTKEGTKGGNIAFGYPAELLPQVCNVWLDADEAEVLLPAQQRTAARCKILIKGFAVVGIIALVDEATGYQEVRNRDELHQILAAYISPELLPWAKRFPDEFYKHICRLHGWRWNPFNPAGGPQLIGKITNQLVYDKLPDGVIDELRRKNPVVYNHGRRKYKNFQFLTDDIGNPHLEKQVAAVTTLMRASPNKKVFDILFNNAFPTSNMQIEMPLDQEGELLAAMKDKDKEE